MHDTVRPPIFKLWLASVVYILALILGIGFVFQNVHFPVWFELVLKSTAVLAFLIIVLAPAIHAATRLRSQKRSKALIVAALTAAAGYALLFGGLVYVKLKTCDINAIPFDTRWHCNVEGKGIIVYFVLIPILAAIIGVAYAGLVRLMRKVKPKS